MNTKFFTILMMAVFFSTATTQLTGQCGMIGLVGEFSEWGAQPDFVMDRDADNPALFTTILTLTAEDDTDGNGFADIKFRANSDWADNWGSTEFPAGTAEYGLSDNLPALPGTYYVSFNCETGDFSFVNTYGSIGLVGEFTAWGADPDFVMDRDANNPAMFTTILTLTAEDDTDGNGFADIKFRADGDWADNWGSMDFPAGTAEYGSSDNLPALPGTYFVTFNTDTGDYSFVSTYGSIGLVGEFTAWGADPDLVMDRDANNPAMFTTLLTLTAEDDTDGNGFADIKFRADGDWADNWGSMDFPAGTGEYGSSDNLPALPGKYFVTFNTETGAYSFVSTCGEISMIGEFNNWAGDFPMHRDATDPNMWTAIKSFAVSHEGDSPGDIQMKFRQDNDWPFNWGGPAFPSGIATLGSADNIPAVVGTYDVSFNCETLAYDFAVNDAVCGDIGMVGDFNNWGTEEGSALPTDLNLVRDPNHPSQFSLDYSFTSSTGLLFRENADPLFAATWGGVSFPTATGISDGGVTQLAVPGGNYRITFDCKSGDYNFIRLGSSVSAPQVFALGVDGDLSEPDWNFSQNVSGIVAGEAGDDPALASFAVAYNAEVLYVAGKITDATVIGASDAALIYVDGNKNGGDYDDNDIALAVYADGTYAILAGSEDLVPEVAVVATADGYAVEVSIAWADLAVTPESGNQIGFDFGVTDFDGADFQSTIMWNGNAGNDGSTSSFGDLLFGDLACGNLSIYSDMIGDVALHTPTDAPTTYVATYDFEEAGSILFRKDNDAVVSWGVDAFPTGNATVGGDAIPVTAGRYRVEFSCLDGAFSFTEEAAGAGVAYANYTSNDVTVDGDLSEFSLDYDMAAGVVDGSTTDNTVAWGALWDEGNLYLAAQVTDANIEGSGNPWDNDAIEMYFDGNHDSDGGFDGDFDTQLILDVFNGSTLWAKADGVPITDFESNLTPTANGYNIELRLAWSDFAFVPGRNRTMGFTIGNNDNDDGIGRKAQTAWYGTADNWNNTAVHGDLQLAGGPLVDSNEPTMFNDNLNLFPNPALSKGVFFVSSNDDVFKGEAQMLLFNLIGQNVLEQNVDFSTGNIRVETTNLTAGTYFLVITTTTGKRAVKKVILK